MFLIVFYSSLCSGATVYESWFCGRAPSRNQSDHATVTFVLKLHIFFVPSMKFSSSGILRSEDWHLPTFRPRTIGLIFKVFYPTEDGIDSLSRNVSKCQSSLRNIPEERKNSFTSRWKPEITYETECFVYRFAPHNDVSVKDGPQIRRWSHKGIIL